MFKGCQGLTTGLLRREKGLGERWGYSQGPCPGVPVWTIAHRWVQPMSPVFISFAIPGSGKWVER